ncbi:hypothetical protein HanXRQr2_Chr17g0810751 [Helianthus annuus]|uniref:Uncharacterized protein n=1 Tax=Helianthus annuus TaxID=4232 RepID=A0A9K3DK54_HELAN|nr:hypothetical protein HanXRQr2_Chr17g0810751 [Helianthus annuus]
MVAMVLTVMEIGGMWGRWLWQWWLVEAVLAGGSGGGGGKKVDRERSRGG